MFQYSFVSGHTHISILHIPKTLVQNSVIPGFSFYKTQNSQLLPIAGKIPQHKPGASGVLERVIHGTHTEEFNVRGALGVPNRLLLTSLGIISKVKIAGPAAVKGHVGRRAQADFGLLDL